MSTVEFPQVIERGCGLDVHRDTVVASIQGIDLVEETQTFFTFTSDLERLICWLQNHGITHVAMESTGVYWKPVFNILESEFEVLLVNARHIKYVPGRKSDISDAQWIGELLQHGLLKASYIP